jgi:heme/copper-type cytochrome/quinol oxidase subunit 1
MLLVDRRLGGSFFTGGAGGAPLLWQHLSYIFLAGTYMLVAIFAIGAITEIVQTFTRRPLRGRNAVVRSMIAIAILGTLAWTQNMYTAPIPSFWKYLSMFLAIALIVPFGVIFQSLISAVAKNDFNMSAPLRYAMGALSFASVGLIVEVSQSMLAIGTQLQQTYDAWAATHFALFGFAVFGGLAALSYWYPKLTGTYLNEERAAKSFWLTYAGGLIALVPLFGAGVEGQVTDAFRFFGGEGLGFFNLVSSIGTLVLFLGLVLTIGNLIRSRVEEKPAPPDPWRGETLEWLTTSPPPPHNFDVLPDVRSANPMSDIREVLAKMDSGEARETRESEPVA